MIARVHPPGLRTLFFTEMWERFSYYGMRALLVLFMTATITEGGLGLDDVTATAIYGLYTAAVYVAALPGGWIADFSVCIRLSSPCDQIFSADLSILLLFYVQNHS